jgi:ribonuclease P protein component
MRLHWGEIKSGYDIVIVARPSAKDSDYGKFESAIFHLLNLHHLLKDDDLE